MAATQRARNKMEQFSDAPMHVLFLGETKHLMAHVDHLFGNKNSIFQKSCWIISKHIKFSKDISLKWCLIADFADAESISTTVWQSAQYVAFSCLSLVYFALLEDFKNNFDETKLKTFQQIFVLWFLLMLSLFLENVCHPDLVDDYVSLFLSSFVCYGISTKKNTKYHSHTKEKRGKEAFFKDTSNYFSLLNLMFLIERFGSLRNLWEGEREKIIKYIKVDMNTMCDTETYMPCVLNYLLCTHCLNNIVKDNQHYQEPKMSKMRLLNFIQVVMHFMKTFQLGKCCRMSLSSHQNVMRGYMFAMKKGITVSLCLRG